MEIIINPGSGAVAGATRENAAENMKHLITDLNLDHKLRFFPVSESDYGDGRFCFIICDYENNTFHEVQMPGLSLNKVRYMRGAEQNIWHFPRLYIDDSSWVWYFAVDILRKEFSYIDEED